jgi:hypothetical protein
MNFYRQIDDKGVIELLIKAAPNSSKSEVVGITEDALKIKLKAPPVDGEANEELVRFLSKWLKVAKSDIIIHKGSASKNKKIVLPLNEQIIEKLKEIK